MNRNRFEARVKFAVYNDRINRVQTIIKKHNIVASAVRLYLPRAESPSRSSAQPTWPPVPGCWTRFPSRPPMIGAAASSRPTASS